MLAVAEQTRGRFEGQYSITAVSALKDLVLTFLCATHPLPGCGLVLHHRACARAGSTCCK